MPIHDWTRVSAGIFHDFHTVWMGELRTALNSGVLPPDYYALAEQVAGPFGPDVLTLQTEPSNGEHNGGTAVAVAAPKVRFTAELPADPYVARRRRLVIHHSSNDRVVALLEILSPGNKAASQPLQAFVEKATAAINEGLHLLIVDLFPPSPRDPDGIHDVIWRALGGKPFVPPSGKPLTEVSYATGPTINAYIEPLAVGDLLTPMPLFLTHDHYVAVPLEETYQAAYRGVPRRWREVLERAP